MKQKISLIALTVCILFCFSLSPARGEEFPTRPVTKAGEKWRIGYLEGGAYPDYQVILKAIVNGLASLGWMKEMQLPEGYNPDHRAFWEWLSMNAESEYIEFVHDAFWTSDFDKKKRQNTRSRVLKRLKRKDIDLMLALGTWAGQDLATGEHSTPTIVASASDPIGSNIVRSARDSGYAHLHAKVDPDRYQRQLRLFHDIIGFSKLGIVYEDSREGKTFGGVNAVEAVAKERGFEIVRCFAPFNNVTQQEAEKAVVQCYEELAPKVDAVYISVHRGINLKNMPTVLMSLFEHQVPSFSMLGSEEVKHGVLMSIAQAGFKYVGQFHAEVIAKIFNGAKAGELNQVWSDPPKIALNLKTAEKISYDPPYSALAAADEVYSTIAVVE